MEIKSREETRNDILFETRETTESSRMQKMTRNYKIKIWGSRVIIDATTTPGWRYVLKIGELKSIVSSSQKQVWQIARHMRIRPEAVFQLLSDAFDESLANRTMVAEDGCLRFESDIATITLDPGEKGLSWELKYKAKEAMYNKAISRHPKEAFTIPNDLFNGTVMLPIKSLHRLIALVEEDIQPSIGLLDTLNRYYCRALSEETIISDTNNLTLSFKTCFRTPNGQGIYAAIEPFYYDPIPNTWRLSRFWCTEDQE